MLRLQEGIVIDQLVRNFRDCLISSWPSLQATRTEEEIAEEARRETFFQALWEMLVEWPLFQESGGEGGYLAIYGSGADLDDSASSRVTYRDRLPTHEVYCEGKGEKELTDPVYGGKVIPDQFAFDGFVWAAEGKHSEGPPFDHVQLRRGNKISIVRVNDVLFKLRAVGQVE